MKHIIALSAAMLVALHGAALTIESTAGKLSEAVGTATDATTLTVSGTINAADLMFIHSEMTRLAELDLAGAAIVDYDGEQLLNSVAQSAAGTIPPAAFLGMPLTSFAFPSNTTSIGEGAFAATRLTSVDIPAGVTTIGNSAFADSPALASAKLPATVSRLGTGVFHGCTQLASVDIAAPIAAIPAATFSGCSALGTIALPAATRVIGERAFANSGLTAITLNDIDSIAPWAFTGCDRLEAVTFAGSMPRAIGQGAFFRDSKAEIGNGFADALTTIPDHAFTGVKSVASIASSPVEQIGDYALAYTAPGAAVGLPATVAKIGNSAFANWTGVTAIDATELEELPDLGDDIFGNLDKPSTTLYVSAQMKPLFENAPQWKDFDIVARSSSTLITELPANSDAPDVKAWFDGSLLRLEANTPITTVELYDMAGLRLTALPAGASTTFTLDTAPFASHTFIARVILGETAAKILKLAR